MVSGTKTNNGVKKMTTNNNNTIDLLEVIKGNQDIKVTNTERLNRFLCFGGDVDSINEYNETLLHEAARSGDIETAKFLIEKGANVNAIDVDGGTPLHYAACNAHLETVKLLIDNGADINAQDFDKKSPLQFASMFVTEEKEGCQQIATIKYLILNGSDYGYFMQK